jgi:hypothetical protein
MLAGAVGDGVKGSDVAAHALQPMLGKDQNSLGMTLNDLAHQAIACDQIG